jgi:hypothetical protein
LNSLQILDAGGGDGPHVVEENDPAAATVTVKELEGVGGKDVVGRGTFALPVEAHRMTVRGVPHLHPDLLPVRARNRHLMAFTTQACGEESALHPVTSAGFGAVRGDEDLHRVSIPVVSSGRVWSSVE